jgi:NAD(P)-dependent dehydrogenase (short-subunit alcohol dehydrogenase family)
MKELRNKIAVVTGGGSGIGRGLVRALAAEGMKVVVADIELDAAQTVAKEVDGLALHVDTSNYESVLALADEVYERFGAVHVLCNNAGVGIVGSLSATTVDDWRWIVSVNVYGPIHGVLSFVPRMIAQGGEAHIVNTGSVAGLAPLPGLPAYSTSKFAVVGLSEAMREELAPHGIGVTVICPGSVRTRILEAARNRPAEFPTTGAAPELRQVSMADAIDPDDLGRQVCTAIRSNDLYVMAFSDQPSNRIMPGLVRDRCAAVLAALAGRDG